MRIHRVVGTNIAALLVGFSIGIGGYAAADFAPGPLVDAGTVGGYSYDGRSGITTNTSTNSVGEVFIRTRGGATVPPGYMGGQAQSIRGFSLCEFAGPRYSTGNVVGFKVSTPVPDCGRGDYRGQGYVEAFRRDGTYKRTDVPASPFQNQGS